VSLVVVVCVWWLGGVSWCFWCIILVLVLCVLVLPRTRDDDDDDVMTTTTTMRSRFRLHFGTFHEHVVCGVCFFASFMLSSAFDRKKGRSIGKKGRKRNGVFRRSDVRLLWCQFWEGRRDVHTSKTTHQNHKTHKSPTLTTPLTMKSNA